MKKNLLFLLAAVFAVIVLALALSPLPASGLGDALFSNDTQVAAANATNTSTAFDLATAKPDQLWKKCYVLVSLPAVSATNWNVVFNFQDSADNSSWANTVPQQTLNIKDGGVAVAATNFVFHIPKNVRRYIRVWSGQVSTGTNYTTWTNTTAIIVP